MGYYQGVVLSVRHAASDDAPFPSMVFAVNASTGQELWSYGFEHRIVVHGRFPVADGKVYLLVAYTEGSSTTTVIFVLNVFPERSGGVLSERVINVRLDGTGPGET